jgi:hypothetical protein
MPASEYSTIDTSAGAANALLVNRNPAPPSIDIDNIVLRFIVVLLRRF